MSRGKKILPFLLLLLPVILYLPFIGKVALPKSSPYSDLLISHLPNSIFTHRSIIQFHQIPLWNDTIMSGYPFIADPLSGLWYFPLWLANWIPLPATLNFLFIVHIFFGGLGLYLLLKKEDGIHQYAAILSAVMFECLPKTWAHFSAGHVTLVFAVYWTPWLLLAAKNRWQKDQARFRLTFESLILAMIIFCDVRWSVYAAGLWAAFSIREVMLQKKKAVEKTTIVVVRSLAHLISQLLISFLLTAAFLLPFLEFVSLSSRSSLPASQNLFLSLPILNLFNLFVPAVGGYAEWVLYLGGIGIIGLLLCLFNKTLRKRTGFWLIVFGVCLLLSLGANIPGLSFIFSLPVLNLLRVPARINFLTGLIACILAGYSVSWFLSEKRILPWLRLTIIAVLMTYLILGIGISLINKRMEIGILWAFLMLVSVFIISLLFTTQKIQPSLLFGIFIGVAFLDYSGINLLSMKFQVYSTPPGNETLTLISSLPGFIGNRIYSPSFSVSQLDASAAGLSLVNGIDPLSMQNFTDFMVKASGVPNMGYSVTIPSLATGNPDSDNKGYVPNLELLGLLNTKYLVSTYPIDDSGLPSAGKFNNLFVYENSLAKPPVWLEGSSGLQATQIKKYKKTPNYIHVSASGPGILVLSEINYPGWIAKVDGNQVPIKPYLNLLRSIDLSAGDHYINIEFQPKLLATGAAISGATGLILALYFSIILFRRKTKGANHDEKLV